VQPQDDHDDESTVSEVFSPRSTFDLEDEVTVLDQRVRSQAMLEATMDEVLREVPCETGFILEFDAAAGQLTILAARGTSRRSRDRFSSSQGVAGFACSEGVCLTVNDLRKDVRFGAAGDTLLERDAKSVLCLPLRSSDKVVGAVLLVNRRGRGFDQADVHRVGSFSSSLSKVL
jgi:GAF domain-containing protein